MPGNKFEVWVFNALKHCAGRMAEGATPLVASASSSAVPASARTAPAAQTMPAALRGFSFTFHVFGVQHIVGGDYPIRVDCNDFNDPYRNPELHAHPGWHSQTLWNCFRSESWENLLRNLFRWIRDEAAPGQHLFWDFLYDRTLQERCGGVASGRGFEAGGCRQDHRPVIILQGRRANGATFVAIVKIAERTIRQSKRAEESSSNSTDGAVGRIDAKMVSVS